MVPDFSSASYDATFLPFFVFCFCFVSGKDLSNLDYANRY